MAAYVLVDDDVTDPARFARYRERVLETIERFGGRFLVRGGRHETIEGSWKPKRIVLIEFPSVAQAKAWYESPEYQAIIQLRIDSTEMSFFTIIEGV